MRVLRRAHTRYVDPTANTEAKATKDIAGADWTGWARSDTETEIRMTSPDGKTTWVYDK